MKSCTDLPQSKKLAHILSVESADMSYLNDGTAIKINANSYNNAIQLWKDYYVQIIPCWSLTALLNVLPNNIGRHTKTLYWFDDAWHCEYVDGDSAGLLGTSAENTIDACVKMIIKLKDKDLL